MGVVNKARGSRILRFIRNLAISIFVLLVVTVGGGVAYTWYMGQNSDGKSASVVPVSNEEPTAPVVKRVQPGANVPTSAAIQTLTSPVAPGSNASVTIKTNAEAECSITAIYNKVASTDSGLGKKQADEYGVLSWVWTVEPTVPLGKWPVTITCINNEKSAVVVGDLVVANKPR